MRTLFLAWQDHLRTRAWYPVGRLDASPAVPRYRFRYVQGAMKAHKEASFEPLDSFPSFESVYEDRQLFPLFVNRLMAGRRVDFGEYLERLGLTPETADPIEILAVSEGTRQTDNLEVFPRIERRGDGTFCCRFFLHGWRHVSSTAQDRIRSLRPHDRLQVALELNNPATIAAIQIQTANDYLIIGWAPRYLVGDLTRAMAESPVAISASVVKLNPEPAPSRQRLLVELSGRWPADYAPMSTADFQPLVRAGN